MSYSAEPKTVYELFNRKCYLIPRNQRHYVWDKRNWEELFDDISFVGENESASHFLGGFVFEDAGRKDGLQYFYIIDGQQRIITLTILIASIMYWLKRNQCMEDYNGTRQYIFASDDKAKELVMLRSDYHYSLESIVKAIDSTTQIELQSVKANDLIKRERNPSSCDNNVVDAFKYFIERIGEEIDRKGNPQNYLTSLRNAALRTTDISITSTTEEDSYTIFEILNARGLSLGEHELLKNYIMRYILPESRRDKAKEIWAQIETDLNDKIEKFIKHYARHKCVFKRSDKISEYKYIQRAYRGNNTESLLNDLRKKSAFYRKIISPATECDSNTIEFRLFSFLKKKRQEQFRPLFLSLMHQNDLGLLSEEQYEKILYFLYNFYICYNIIGRENSNMITDQINKYAELFENHYNETLISEFIETLKKRLPDREAFVNAFSNLGWSNHFEFYRGDKNKEQVQTVLEVLELHINGFCLPDFTIEHVLDDSKSEKNGQIGNLIPLEEKLNKKLRGKTYHQKIECYKQSNYCTTRMFVDRFHDDNFDPSKRTTYLANLFYDEILKL